MHFHVSSHNQRSVLILADTHIREPYKNKGRSVPATQAQYLNGNYAVEVAILHINQGQTSP